MIDRRAVEDATRKKYTSGIYKAETISLSRPSADGSYVERMLRLKFDLIEQYLPGDVIVDLCCGSGVHLHETARGRRRGIGLDFSAPFIEFAEKAAKQSGIGNVDFIQCDAKSIPIEDEAVDALYSLSSLYYVADIESVFSEISRVLRQGGRCLLDLGNERSLNGIVCREYPDLSQLCGVDVPSIDSICRASGLRIIEHRCFQILPMWADKPRWLGPLLHPGWKTLLSRRVAGRMLDEWISSLPILRRYAFRHVLVCEKC